MGNVVVYILLRCFTMQYELSMYEICLCDRVWKYQYLVLACSWKFMFVELETNLFQFSVQCE